MQDHRDKVEKLSNHLIIYPIRRSLELLFETPSEAEGLLACAFEPLTVTY